MATSNFWNTAPRIMNTLKNAYSGMVPKTFQKAVFKHGEPFPPGFEGGMPTWIYTEFPTLAAQATDDCIMDLTSDFVLLGYTSQAFAQSPFSMVPFTSGLQTGVSSYVFEIADPVVAGDQITFGVELNGTGSAPSSVIDNLGNTWTQESDQVGGGDNHNFAVYNCSVTNAGDMQVTVTLAAPVNLLLHGVHISGSGAIQLTSPANNTGTSAAWSSVALTPSGANTMLLAFSVGYGPPMAPSDSFTLQESGLVPGSAATTQLAMASLAIGASAATQSKWAQNSSAEWQTVLVGFQMNAQAGTPDFRIQIYDVNGEVDLIPGKAINRGNHSGDRGRLLYERNPYTFVGSDPQCEIRISNLSTFEIDVQVALYGLQGVPQ